jgi:poly-gamma-glutamate synthase PgsB/CapB
MQAMNESLVRQLLAIDEHPLLSQVDARQLNALLVRYRQWPGAQMLAKDEPLSSVLEARRLVRFLSEELLEIRKQIQRLVDLRSSYQARVEGDRTLQEQRAHTLDFARELGASRWDLLLDRRAFKRWFDLDAVMDRCLEQRARQEQRMAFCLKRLEKVAAWLMKQDGPAFGPDRLWKELDLERVLLPLLTFEADPRVRLAAFKAILSPLRELPLLYHEHCLSDGTMQFIHKTSQDPDGNVWIQCEALALLPEVDPGAFMRTVAKRLQRPGPKDDLFFRKKAVDLLGRYMARFPELPEFQGLIALAMADPSPYVRKAIPAAIAQHPIPDHLSKFEQLVLEDPIHQVRASCLLALSGLISEKGQYDWGLKLLIRVLREEKHPFVARTALRIAEEIQQTFFKRFEPSEARAFWGSIRPVLEEVHSAHPRLEVRRWASQTREAMWGMADDEARSLYSRLSELVDQVEPGKTKRLREVEGLPRPLIARVLSQLARKDFGFDLRWRGKRLYVTRGPVIRFRLWRALYEFMHPSPDKRMAHPHTVGRLFHGQVHVPSHIMGELSETKVPGEPLFISTEAGWRPYLPLPDEVLSTLHVNFRGPSLEIYTSEGITELTPPRSLAARIKAKMVLTTKFAEYARLRNWVELDQIDPGSYAKALQKLGFQITQRPYDSAEGLGTGSDPAVQRFFPALAFLGLPPMLNSLRDYFFSIYENSLYELWLFTSAMIVYFFSRNIIRYQILQYHRRRIPLVIGGWGTRGKSGTERLKAAFFSGLGYGVVSKTTGCEAMFLYGKPYQELKEMYMFRPYDKTSIQEQYAVVKMSSGLGTDVLLWECMALVPAFVKLLEHYWMRNDFCTLTNTFPDHEDIQGPAGYDIPTVMTNFVPKQRMLFTAEENMLPIIAEEARKQDSPIRGVTWLDSGLITDDVMSRFPYQEHPDNIALVLKISHELGVNEDFAVKEMADRVVEDIGVLKTFPPGLVNGRRVEFTNGMSANEPFGCLGNWQRVGFTQHDPEQNPGAWISTVVNNRADRVARSQVFAKLIAESLYADRHFLIGDNLNGLRGYIEQSYDEVLKKLTLWPDGKEDHARAASIFRHTAHRLRIVYSEEGLLARVAAMLNGLGWDPEDEEEENPHLATREGLVAIARKLGLEVYIEDMEAHRQAWSDQLATCEAFVQRVKNNGETMAELDKACRMQMREWFLSRLHPIENYNAPGEQIVQIIANTTPPGFLNRCMGVQNIKGTGLDFVYRFFAWNKCHASCSKLKDDDFDVVSAGLQELLEFKEFGYLSREYVLNLIDQCEKKSVFEDPELSTGLKTLRARIEEQMHTVQEHIAASEKPTLKDKFYEILENLLDTQDSIKRRKLADQVYKDLINGRISRTKAVKQLQYLNNRQMGGWMSGKVMGGVTPA